MTEADIGGRFGGDEFIVILYDESEEIVSMTASRIQEYVWSDAYISQIPVTLSIGGAAWQGNITEYDAKSLLERADAALYQSKERGRDRYTFLPMEI